MRMPFLMFVLCLVLASPAGAFIKLDGYFIALEACEAYQSKNKQTNPGGITTTRHMAYEMLGINKENGDFFQVHVDNAPVTTSRWVSAACGLHVVAAGTQTGLAPVDVDDVDDVVIDQDGAESIDNLLTLSWQSAFCEIRPGKTECRDLNDDLLPHTTRQLSIHGLWPQPKGKNYCGVPNSVKKLDKPESWAQLPIPAIDTDTEDELRAAMPGFASFLHHHEWIKHGTCYLGDGGADEYYDDTLYLTGLINESAVVDLFVNNVGQEITGTDIRAAFDSAFGKGTGDRVLIKCTRDDGRTLISELWINLKGKITQDADLGELMLAANTTGMGCQSGIVDAAGLQ